MFARTDPKYEAGERIYSVPPPTFIHGVFARLARYEQPLVVPQSSQTWHAPFCFTRIEPQLPHCSPV